MSPKRRHSAAAREPDPARRNALFADAEKLLVSGDAAVAPVYHYVGVQFYHGERLAGLRANLIDDHPFRCMWWRK